MSLRRALAMLMSSIALLTISPTLAFTQPPSPEAAAALGRTAWELVALPRRRGRSRPARSRSHAHYARPNRCTIASSGSGERSGRTR